MSIIEESVKTKALPNIVFKVWADKYITGGFEVGKKGHVINEKKKGIKFKIHEVKENESLTVIWYSHFVKLIFLHEVKKIENGSLIVCKVKLKGLFAFILRPLISNKIRKNLQMSLTQFARDLNLR
ncbi:MAG: hypothetical protein KR126chlam6_00278 [Candidatus Anoxychlamydiales bacterium]|nr:hypothetical protein [Candidatus Anoxychlamydiales bacterium]